MDPNGSGKTTLLKCLLNLEKFDGKILIDGHSNGAELKNFLAVWDDCPFYLNNSGLENLLIFAEGKKEIIDMSKNIWMFTC